MARFGKLVYERVGTDLSVVDIERPEMNETSFYAIVYELNL